MWRAFFWSVGIYACLLGAECMVVEKAILHGSETAVVNRLDILSPPRQKEFAPPDWAPWSLLSFGAITLIYTITLPKRASG